MVLRIKKRSVVTPTAQASWFFDHGGIEYGPVTWEQLLQSVESGLLLPTDSAWNEGSPTSVPAGNVDGLFPLPDESIAEPPVPAPSPKREQTGRLASWPPPSGKGSVTCPYCWYRFEPENVLYIAQHPDLVGDPLLGPDQPTRFRPDRFNTIGQAIDAGDMACHEMACPYCHLRIPPTLLSMPPMFVSLVGAPASGKSYFLAAMAWRLRTTLRQHFLIGFDDADNSINGWINDYEERLFLQADATTTQVIEKTQMELTGDNLRQGPDGKLQGQRSHYHAVNFNGMSVALPKPVIFNLQSEPGSIFHQDHELCRSLVLYDNAGEQFLPGNDTADKPGSRHLAYADAVMFLFDPTADPGFRQLLSASPDVQLRQRKHVRPQHVLVTESMNRIRLHLGLDPRTRYNRPVLVLVSKSDVLGSITSECLGATPWREDKTTHAASLDMSFIMRISYGLRALLFKFAPQFVTAVENSASDVTYIPISSLGGSPEVLGQSDGEVEDDVDKVNLGVRPCNIRPMWVEMPLLYVLCRLGYVPGFMVKDASIPEPTDFEVRGEFFHFTVPSTQEYTKVPVSYAGVTLVCPVTSVWFRVPEKP